MFWRTAAAAVLAASAALCAHDFALVGTGSVPSDGELFVVCSDGSHGDTAALALDPPWNAAVGLEPVGARPVVRYHGGLYYVVDGASASVQVIDAETRDTRVVFSVGGGSDPRDTAVVDHATAYVSRYERAALYKVDPRTGQGFDAVDLSVFADEDGLPEMAMMALDRGRLYVQLQRIDRDGGYTFMPPSYLAVVDVATDTLVDADPVQHGVQAIALQGPLPDFKMQIESERRRLYLCTPGFALDDAGGIEEIDLAALASLGFITSEQQITADLGGFVLVSPTRGYVIVHTDIVASSHLVAFSRVDGSHLGEKHMTFGTINQVDADLERGYVYFPDVGASPPGVHVFDAASGKRLTRSAVPTGLPPQDVVVVSPLERDARGRMHPGGGAPHALPPRGL